MYEYDYNDEKFVFGSNTNTCSDNNYTNNNNNKNSQRRPMEASNPRHLHFILDPLRHNIEALNMAKLNCALIHPIVSL